MGACQLHLNWQNYMVFKKKVRKSHLIWGEGLEDKALFKHFLRELKADEKESVYIHPGCGTGGSARDVIDSAVREIGNFNKRLIILDRDDKSEKEIQEITNYVLKKGINVHFVTPCLEAVILHILAPSAKWKKLSTQDCKHEVEVNHIARKKRTDEHAYKKLTYAKILKAAKTDSELQFLIDYITLA